MIRIGALISGGGSNLQAIIDACESGKTDGRVVFVGSDNPEAGGLARARRHALPTFVVDYGAIVRQHRQNPDTVKVPDDFNLDAILSKQHVFDDTTDSVRIRRFFASRAIAESALLSEMDAWPFDLLVLAGFMRNLSPYFIDRINTVPDFPRIMNIHPALLPAFPGIDGYGDTFRYGCKVGGCTVHFIDYGEDSGPIIGQRAFPIEENDTLDSIRDKGLRLEWDLYPECIQLFAEGRLRTVVQHYALDKGRTSSRKRVVISPAGGDSSG